MLVRSGGLAESMSRYLIQRIAENPGIELHYKTEIVSLEGDAHLERVSWVDKTTGGTSVHEIRHVFIMAGASPRTEWLRTVSLLTTRASSSRARMFLRPRNRVRLSPGHSPGLRKCSKPASPGYLRLATCVREA